MSRLNAVFAAGVLLTAAAGCGGGSPPPPGPVGPAPLAPVSPADRLYDDNGEGITDSVRIVVRDASDLRDVWARATSRQPSPPPPPNVDFNEHMVVVVGAGRMTPEDQIRVDSVGVREVTNAVGRTERALLVLVRTIEGCQQFNVAAYPVQIVRVPYFDGPVRFVERREKDPSCGTGEEWGAVTAARNASPAREAADLPSGSRPGAP